MGHLNPDTCQITTYDPVGGFELCTVGPHVSQNSYLGFLLIFERHARYGVHCWCDVIYSFRWDHAAVCLGAHLWEAGWSVVVAMEVNTE